MLSEKYRKKIEAAIKTGQRSAAIKLITGLKKTKSHNNLEKIQISEWHKRLGEPEKALKLLGPPATKTELKIMSKDGLCVQITIANLLRYLGAKYLAQKIFNNVNKLVDEKKINLTKIFPGYFKFKALAHLSEYNFKAAETTCKEALNLCKKDSYEYKIAKIRLADALEGLGKTTEAIKTLAGILETALDTETVLKGICHQARGEYFFRSGHFKNARKEFETSKKYFISESRTPDLADLARWSGGLYLECGCHKEAKDDLLFALDILNHPGTQPSAIISVLYWLDKLPNYNLPIEYKIPLRAHFIFSPYAYMAGKQFTQTGVIHAHPWMFKRYAQTTADCWLITNDKITAIEYEKTINQVPMVELTDLYSGIIFRKNGKTILPELESMCLAALVSAGELGANELALVDFIYRQDFYDLQSGILRTRRLISRLCKKGFKITKKNNYYFIDHLKNVAIPMNLNNYGIHNYLMARKQVFTNEDIVKLLNLSARTSARYINDWHKNGTIKKCSDIKNSYIFAHNRIKYI